MTLDDIFDDQMLQWLAGLAAVGGAFAVIVSILDLLVPEDWKNQIVRAAEKLIHFLRAQAHGNYITVIYSSRFQWVIALFSFSLLTIIIIERRNRAPIYGPVFREIDEYQRHIELGIFIISIIAIMVIVQPRVIRWLVGSVATPSKRSLKNVIVYFGKAAGLSATALVLSIGLFAGHVVIFNTAYSTIATTSYTPESLERMKSEFRKVREEIDRDMKEIFETCDEMEISREDCMNAYNESDLMIAHNHKIAMVMARPMFETLARGVGMFGSSSSTVVLGIHALLLSITVPFHVFYAIQIFSLKISFSWFAFALGMLILMLCIQYLTRKILNHRRGPTILIASVIFGGAITIQILLR